MYFLINEGISYTKISQYSQYMECHRNVYTDQVAFKIRRNIYYMGHDGDVTSTFRIVEIDLYSSKFHLRHTT